MGNVPPARWPEEKWSFFVDNLVKLRIGLSVAQRLTIQIADASNGKYRDSLQTKE